jgi:hypothetical protein
MTRRVCSRSVVLWLGLALVLFGFFSPVLTEDEMSIGPLVPVRSAGWLEGAAIFLALLGIARWLRLKAIAGLAVVAMLFLGVWVYRVLSDDRREAAEFTDLMSSEKGQYGLSIVNPVELDYGFFLLEAGLAFVVVSRLCFRPKEASD